MMKVLERHYHQAGGAGLLLLPDRLDLSEAGSAGMRDSAVI